MGPGSSSMTCSPAACGSAGRTGSPEPKFQRESPRFAGRGLHGGIVYTDGQFDDSRLAITLARTLADLGGTVLNYAAVTKLHAGATAGSPA